MPLQFCFYPFDSFLIISLSPHLSLLIYLSFVLLIFIESSPMSLSLILTLFFQVPLVPMILFHPLPHLLPPPLLLLLHLLLPLRSHPILHFPLKLLSLRASPPSHHLPSRLCRPQSLQVCVRVALFHSLPPSLSRALSLSLSSFGVFLFIVF